LLVCVSRFKVPATLALAVALIACFTLKNTLSADYDYSAYDHNSTDTVRQLVTELYWVKKQYD